MSEGKSAATPQRSEAEFNFGQLVADLTSDIDEKICAMGRGEIRFMPEDLTKLVAAHLAPICDWVKEAGSVAAPKAQPDTGTPTLNSQIARHEAIEAAPEHKTHTVWRQRVDTWKDLETGAYIAILPEHLTQGTTEERAIEAAKSTMKFYAKLTEHEGNWPEVGAPKAQPFENAAQLAEVWLENGWDFAGLAPAIRAMGHDAGENPRAGAPKAGEPPQELIERARAAWKVVIHPALLPAARALSYEECRASDELIVREMANFAESELRVAGETPAERPYGPDPNASYLCVYCNKKAKLREAEVVVDCYQNVVHLECLPPGAGSTKEGK